MSDEQENYVKKYVIYDLETGLFLCEKNTIKYDDRGHYMTTLEYVWDGEENYPFFFIYEIKSLELFSKIFPHVLGEDSIETCAIFAVTESGEIDFEEVYV